MGASQKKRLQALSSNFRRKELGRYRRLSMEIHNKAVILKNQANGQH